MAALIGAFDWAATPLGPITHRPQSLKAMVYLMLSSSSMMSLVWGTEAIHLYNDSFTDLPREHRVQVLGWSAFETFARSRGVFAADIAAGMAGRSARLIGQRHPVLRNGRLEDAWFDVEYAPIHDDAGCVAGVLWTLKETTARHLAEQALRASEERHRLLIESWAQAVWETEANGVVTVDSPSWRAYTGQTLDAWPDQNAPDLICVNAGSPGVVSLRGQVDTRGVPMPDAARPLDGRRILIVEDEYLIAMEVKRWLQEAGAEVVGPVPSAERALDLIEDDGLDAAVLDVNLGNGDTVYPVADKLSTLGVPYLFATGDVKISGSDAYRQRPRLEKPFVEAELLRATGKLIA